MMSEREGRRGNVPANRIIGGFAMGIVKGAMVRDGRTCPFYGMAELITSASSCA